MTDASRSHSPREAFVPSPGLAGWLADQRLSLAVSIYDPGTLLLVGLADDGQVSVHQTPFPACIRLCADGDRLWIGALQQLWRFDNALRESDRHDGFDRVLVPRVGFATGYVNIHDIGIDERRRPVFVNTWHGCLAMPSLEASFVPIWRPAPVPELAGGSTLHLNGLAMEGGSPRYVTASRWDGTSGDAARSGGAVVDVTTGAVTAGRLSMPHSPRLHGGRLWIIESGTGQLGWIDGKSGTLEAVAFCPGYLRGLALHGDFAAQQEGQLAADGEAQSGAAVFAAGRGIGLLERLEDDLLLLGRDADAGIRDDEARALLVVLPRQRDATSPRRVADRIGDEVGKGAAQLFTIAAHEGWRRFDFDAVMAVRQSARFICQFPQQLPRVDDLVDHRALARFKPRQRQQILDQSMHALCLFVHQLQVVAAH
jgi:uncharacterized protein (TIGR03032 family)